MYQMKSIFQGFPKLVIYHSCRFHTRKNMLSNVQSRYRKVTQETPKNPESFMKFISPAFFEPFSADLLLLKTAVIALIWVMIQLETFLTQFFNLTLLATVLQKRTIQPAFLNKHYLFQSNFIHC